MVLSLSSLKTSAATAGQTPAAQATALFNLINADKPHWITQ